MDYVYIITFCVIWGNNKPKYTIFQRKPFNCELCMAFWITFVYQWLHGEELGLSFIMALIAPVAFNIYNRILRWTLK